MIKLAVVLVILLSSAHAELSAKTTKIASKIAPKEPDFLNALKPHNSEVEFVSDDEVDVNRAHCRLELNSGKMAIAFDQSKWKDGESVEGRYSLNHASGSAFAFIIAEPLVVSLDALPDIALSHARAEDPAAKVVLREKRVVNGVEVWCLKIMFTAKTIPFTYYGYYFSGAAGTVQIVTCTRQNLRDDYQKDFEEFLNGFSLTE